MSVSGIDAYGGNDTVATTHDVAIAQSHIHDIGRICTNETGARSGINAYAGNLVIEQNRIHDIGAQPRRAGLLSQSGQRLLAEPRSRGLPRRG